MTDYYHTLGIERGASEADIKKAYRKLAMEFHPDRNEGSKESEARFKEITEAYDALRDPQKRAHYDRYGRVDGGAGFHHVDLSEALSIFMRDFGGMGGFDAFFGGGERNRHERRRGQDVRIKMRLTLDDVAKGTTRHVKLKALVRCGRCDGSGLKPGARPESCRTCGGHGEVRQATRSLFGQFVSVTTCPACGGEGSVVLDGCVACRGDGRTREERTVKIDVPAGVSEQNYLTLRGEGAAGLRQGPSGDLIVALEVEEDERYHRHGDDLVHDVLLSFSQAALGTELTVPTPYGDESLLAQPGIQSGTVLRLRGQGLPRLGGVGKGDMLVRVQVWTPESMTPEQQRLFEELAEHEDEPPVGGNARRGFWDRLKEALGA